MTRFPRILALAFLLAAVPVHSVGLPDTGQDLCSGDIAVDEGVAASNAASIAGDAGTHPRQDCRYGRDAAGGFGVLTKIGAGPKGFDYTKIANNGTTLAADAELGGGVDSWACTKDNITGLTWEVKVDNSTDLRHAGHFYRWFNTDTSTNGGDSGSTGTNTCNATLPGNLCNTQAFTTAVNVAALCTFTDWRLPTRRELLTLVHAGTSAPSIAQSYFPNTSTLSFWTGSSFAPNPARAWTVSFNDGDGNKFCHHSSFDTVGALCL